MAKTLTQEFTKGLWKEVAPFRLVLGLCPVLGVTTTIENGIGMGLATMFVLVFSNILVASLRNIIPPKVRIACFIIIIATFVVITELLSFTLSLAALGSLRELFGANSLTIWTTPTSVIGVQQVFGPHFQPFTFMVQAPGAFVCLGLMLCIMNLLGTK
jgi:electron transport complex protein RnfE